MGTFEEKLLLSTIHDDELLKPLSLTLEIGSI